MALKSARLLAIGFAGTILGSTGSMARMDAATPAAVEQRPIPVLHSNVRDPGFTMLGPRETGIYFTNHVSIEAVAANRMIEDGSGVAAGDVDGDGLCDLYLCSLEGNNRLFRNLGSLHFEDITVRAGVQCPGQASTGAVFADVDGDGDLDLLVNGLGTGTRLFLNDGHGHFVEKTDAGLGRDSGARSLALADIDGDGRLDLYVCNYRRNTARDSTLRVPISQRGTGFEVPPELRDHFIAEPNSRGGAVVIELGEPDVLYRNVGGGKFEAVSWVGGDFLDEKGQPLSVPPRDWGLSAMFRDLNGDGAPDLYVCNDFHSPDRLWLNNGKGHFRAAAPTALRKMSWASMAVDFADINRDGLDDFFVAEMLGMNRARRQTQRDNLEADSIPTLGWGWRSGEITNRTSVMRNTLFLNLGAGNFVETAQYSGVQASDWTWGVVFLDVDLDGFEDLLMANGHARDHLNSDVQSHLASAGPPLTAAARAALFRQIPPLAVPKRAFRNRGDLTFQDQSVAWGFDWVGISTGMALADLDNDGDLDVILNNLDSGALIMRNDATAPRLAVRVRGQSPNTAGIGAKLRMLAPGLPAQSQEIICGGRYLSGDDPVRAFAAGNTTNRLVVEVTWRTGQRTTLTNVQANQVVTLTEPATPLRGGAPSSGSHETSRSLPTDLQATGATFFEDASQQINLTHTYEPFDEFVRQPLLPRQLSHNGPGVSWVDLNGDGHVDLVVPASHRQACQIRLNDGTGKFSLAPHSDLALPFRADQTTWLSWLTGPGRGMIAVGVSGYETGTNMPASVAIYRFTARDVKAVDGLKAGSGVGPLAAADLDGDGDLELLVAGQAEPGRYPVASRTTIFHQTDGRFVEDVVNTARLASVGLVNGVVWSDLNGDGWPDLILACEWGPIRIFRNEHGQLVEWNPALSISSLNSNPTDITQLSQLTGWWNGVAIGDFNGDGQLDIIASNWGRNTKFQEFIADQLRLYYADLNGDGILEVIEAYWDRDLKKEVPWRDFQTMSRAFPAILERFNTYAGYASASITDLFGPSIQRAPSFRAATLESMLLLNLGDHFEARALPLLAQLAPSFGIAVADFDGDGHEDIFLSQNSFAFDRETGRLDGGRGLWLRGDGLGKFEAVSPQSSGLSLTGEQRGAAVADYDEDGRPDLVVAQHAAPVKLFRNRGGRAGLRVRLVGAHGNFNAIGAQVRLKFGEQYGPTREIHAGSGYWSQDASVIVMAKPSEPTDIWIRWPGGKVTERPLPSNVKEVSVDISGQIQSRF